MINEEHNSVYSVGTSTAEEFIEKYITYIKQNAQMINSKGE